MSMKRTKKATGSTRGASSETSLGFNPPNQAVPTWDDAVGALGPHQRRGLVVLGRLAVAREGVAAVRPPQGGVSGDGRVEPAQRLDTVAAGGQPLGERREVPQRGRGVDAERHAGDAAVLARHRQKPSGLGGKAMGGDPRADRGRLLGEPAFEVGRGDGPNGNGVVRLLDQAKVSFGHDVLRKSRDECPAIMRARV